MNRSQGRMAGWLTLSMAVLSLALVAGCDHDDDDDDNIRMTVINNHSEEVVIQREGSVLNWVFVDTVEAGETRVLTFNDRHSGEDLRAREDGDTVSESEIRDGITWTIP